MCGTFFMTMISNRFLKKKSGGLLEAPKNNRLFWRIPTNPENPDITTQPKFPLPDSTPTPSTPEVAEVSIISSSSLETPQVSLCFAPKKQNLDINF